MRRVVVALFAALIAAAGARAAEPFDAVAARAAGQTVYFNAWGGDPRINAYIAWAAAQVEQRHGIAVRHVKLADTAEAVARVLAEKTAGREGDGSVDLVWINGENFAAMKRHGLLFGPWVEDLPNWRWVDTRNPAARHDFTVPIEGLEAPWSLAQIVFIHDTRRVPEPPRSLAALLGWAKRNPGRTTYPQPPNFLGSTFLKQALIGLTPDPAALQQPADRADYAEATAPLWRWLDELHPVLWRQGRAFPPNGPAQKRLMGDGEIDIAVSFNPAEASAAIESGALPPTVRTFVLDGGTIGNASYLAIPFNARAKEGAMVLTDFLLSPEAQARKQDATVWGSATVLAVDRLPPEMRRLFDAAGRGVATLSPEQLGTPLPEPHPSWMERLEEDWTRRYASR